MLLRSDGMAHGHVDIVVGVTGSAAAFKAASIVSGFVRAGKSVEVILTPAAKNFVGPASFEGLTGRPVLCDFFVHEGQPIHVRLADSAGCLVVAPATAATICKIAHGMADNLLVATSLCFGKKPRFIAPAMEERMLVSGPVQRALRLLSKDGWRLIGPVEGRLASGRVAKGRMAEPEEIVKAVLSAFEGEAQG